MTLTLDLPETTMRWLQSEADASGKDPASFVGEQLAEAQARAEAQAILNGTFYSLAEANARFCEKYSLPDLSQLSQEELDRRINEGLAQVDPANLAEAQRQGLL